MKTATAKATAVQLLADVKIPLPGTDAADRARQALQAAEARSVASNEDYEVAGRDLQAVKTRLAEIEGMRKTLKDPILKAGKAVDDFFRGPLSFLTQAESMLKRKMFAWSQEVDRRRREAQAKADEEARKERERLAAQAERARQKGKLEKAEALEQQAETVVPVAIAEAAPRVAGITPREHWTFEVEDESKIPREYMTPDLVKIGKVVRALKADTRIDGITVINQGTLAASRG